MASAVYRVRQLLKSFRVLVGSVAKLLAPDQWLKERGIYMRIALFCIMAERTKHIHTHRSFRFLAERHKTRYTLGETRYDRSPALRLASHDRCMNSTEQER